MISDGAFTIYIDVVTWQLSSSNQSSSTALSAYRVSAPHLTVTICCHVPSCHRPLPALSHCSTINATFRASSFVWISAIARRHVVQHGRILWALLNIYERMSPHQLLLAAPYYASWWDRDRRVFCCRVMELENVSVDVCTVHVLCI